MAMGFTLYRFRIDLSDITRGVYEQLDQRIAMHPSESHAFLLTRVIAYALNACEGLELTPGGLSDTEKPAIQAKDLWIEVGNPSERKLHRAVKAAKSVKVYTYKNAEQVPREPGVEIFALNAKFLERIATTLERDNRWTLVVDESSLLVTIGDEAFEGEILPI